MQNRITGDSQRIPFLGDIPILGRLAAFDQLTASDAELVVLVTPALVHPLEPNEVGPMNGANMVSPTDYDFFVQGLLFGRRGVDSSGPSVNDHHLPNAGNIASTNRFIFEDRHGHSDNP